MLQYFYLLLDPISQYYDDYRIEIHLDIHHIWKDLGGKEALALDIQAIIANRSMWKKMVALTDHFSTYVIQ